MTSYRTRLVGGALAALTGAALLAAPAAQAAPAQRAGESLLRMPLHTHGKDGRTGRFLVVAERAAAARSVAHRLEALEPLGLSVVDTAPVGRSVAVDVAPGSDALDAAADIDGVVDVVPEVTYSLLDTPNDPAVADQTASFNVLRLPSAWSVTHGSSGVRIAVVDTGVAVDHPDLAGKVVGTYNAVTGSAVVTDKVGHGTFVASVAAAETDNGVGLAGAGWSSSILAVKVADDAHSNQITNQSLADGIDWAVAHGADVINLSLGSYGNDSLTADAVADALAAGVSVVAAAGNDSSSTKMYPAALPYVIAVGATTVGGGSRTDFSQYGSWVDVGAPGASIIGANAAWATGSDYAEGDGTSFAAPLVAGIVGLLRASRPDLDPQEIHAAIKASTNGKDYGFYAGVVNAYQALGYQLELPAPTIVSPGQAQPVEGVIDVELEAPDDADAGRVRVWLEGGPSVDADLADGGSVTVALSTFGLDWGATELHAVRCRLTLCSSTGATVTVLLNNPAPVLTAPAEGAEMDADFTVEGTSTAPNVRVLSDGDPLVTVPVSGGTFSQSVAITALTPGAHTLTAVGCDAAATRCATAPASAPLHVVVNRLRPVISSVAPNPFSPNGDGTNDAVKVTYTLDVASDVVVRFQDGDGDDVRVRALGVQTAGSHSVTWGGTTDGGAALPTGSYTAVLDTTATVGAVEMHGQATKAITLDVTAPALSSAGSTYPTVYPSNDDYRDSTKLSVTSAEAAASVAVTVFDGRGKRVWAASKAGTPAGTVSLTFTGHSSAGSRLAGGTYVYQFRVRDKAGNLSVSGKHKVGVSWKKLVSRTFTKTVSVEKSLFGWGSDGPCSALYKSRWATGAGLWSSCPGETVYSVQRVALPSATVPGVARVSMYGRAASSGAVAYFGYLADDDSTLSGQTTFGGSTGAHSAAAVKVTSALLEGKYLRWVVETFDGDQYEGKSFSITYHYKVLA